MGYLTKFDLSFSGFVNPNIDRCSKCAKVLDVSYSFCPNCGKEIISNRVSIDAETIANKIEGLQTGADDYLTKPFDLQELRVRVENLINIRKKLQEKFSKGDFLLKRSDKKLRSIDEKFLSKVLEVIEKHLSEEEFSIEECSSEVGLSRTHFHKKMRALVGKSPSQYLRTVRLHRAKQMIEEEKGNVSEVAYSVGFSSPAYFSRCFKEEFGQSPSDLLN